MSKEMPEEIGSDGITIVSKGIDGNTIYSVLNSKTNQVIIPFLGLNKFAEKIIQTYPELSKKIYKLCEVGLSINSINNVEMPKEPTSQGMLAEKISGEFKKVRV